MHQITADCHRMVSNQVLCQVLDQDTVLFTDLKIIDKTLFVEGFFPAIMCSHSIGPYNSRCKKCGCSNCNNFAEKHIFIMKQ